jgi:hypothetical protein
MSRNAVSSQVSGQEGRIAALRANALAAIVMLLLEYGLGIWMNLEGHVPGADQGVGFWAAFLDSITRGPLGLTLHAVLGTLIIITSIGLAMRSIATKRWSWSVLALVAFIAVLLAWLSGVLFVSSGDSEPSLVMALWTGVALLCDVLIVFRLTFETGWAVRSGSD